jgi:hypothetical protein
MRNPSVLLLAVIITAVGLSAPRASAQPAAAEPLTGTWSGTWDGAGSGGGFELTFEREKDGPMTGKVSVTGEPAYKASLKTLSFEGTKMSAKYDFTPQGEHYGKLVSNYRAVGIVPPISRKPASQ